MLKQLFPRADVREWIGSGPTGPLVVTYASWMHNVGYRPSTMRQRVHVAARFAHWLDDEKIAPQAIDATVVARFHKHLVASNGAGSKPGAHAHAATGAVRFLEHLRTIGVAPPKAARPSPVFDRLASFAQWMRLHRGVCEKTLVGYRSALKQFIAVLGTDPARYDVAAIRAFILDHLRVHGSTYAKRVGSVLRMYFRFLITQGVCAPELVEAIPKTANWRLTELPRHLPPESIEQVIARMSEHGRAALRDRAIILLLARLGLRAMDIVDLKLADIDFKTARIRVAGKGRRQVWLPLPQDAGDALIAYFKIRPRVPYEHVFLRLRGPTHGFACSGAVGMIVRQALMRASVRSPTGVNSHLFRHSLARRLLAQDVPLEAIGVVLRHRSLETSAKYAKIDMRSLSSVTQRWPSAKGVSSC